MILRDVLSTSAMSLTLLLTPFQHISQVRGLPLKPAFPNSLLEPVWYVLSWLCYLNIRNGGANNFHNGHISRSNAFRCGAGADLVSFYFPRIKGKNSRHCQSD